MTDRLSDLGDALEASARADLRSSVPARRPVRRRRLAVFAAAGVLLVPAAAIGANALLSGEDVAKSIPAGTVSLIGTHPTCTVVKESVEYHCTLAKAPAPEVSDWKGTVEPTVDKTSHVNGGCRSLASDGKTWQCYVGQEAVRQQIIGPDFLGEKSSGPGVG
jgi:hypothetical protein